MTSFTDPAFAAFPEPSDPVWASLDRYLVGAATPDDHTQVEQWCAGDAKRRACVDAWGEAWRRLSPGECTSPEALRRIADQIMAPHAGRVTENQARANSGRKQGTWGTQTLRSVIGGVGVTASAVLIFYLAWLRVVPEPGITHTYATRTNQVASLMLRDGTHVTLAPHTQLRLVKFGTSSRTVIVDGEAYFNVAQSSGAPFVVRSGSVTVQVLGTAFLIRHIMGNPSIRVAVADGKISLTGPSLRRTGWTLAAGDVGNVIDSTVRIETGTRDAIASDGVWRNDEFEFRHARVSKILQTLTRWYGYQFRFTDSALVQQTVTAAISARSSSSALAVLEQVLDVNLSAVGDTITLIPHPSNSIGFPRSRTYDSWTPSRGVGR